MGQNREGGQLQTPGFSPNTRSNPTSVCSIHPDSWIYTCINPTIRIAWRTVLYMFRYSAPFEVVPCTEEPFSHHWLTQHPPRIQRSLFQCMIHQLPRQICLLNSQKGVPLETEQPSLLFARQRSASYWAVLTNTNHCRQAGRTMNKGR